MFVFFFLLKASWLFMMFGTSPMHLGISRILTGIVMGGAQVSSSVYTAEIADNEYTFKITEFN